MIWREEQKTRTLSQEHNTLLSQSQYQASRELIYAVFLISGVSLTDRSSPNIIKSYVTRTSYQLQKSTSHPIHPLPRLISNINRFLRAMPSHSTTSVLLTRDQAWPSRWHFFLYLSISKVLTTSFPYFLQYQPKQITQKQQRITKLIPQLKKTTINRHLTQLQ